MTRRLLALALTLALTAPGLSAQAPASAGEVRGTVVDAGTGQPLGGVQLRIPVLSRSEVSHSDGTFHFHRLPAGEFRVVATRVGYAPAEAVVRVGDGAPAVVHLRMTASAVELGALVVTGTVSGRSGDEVLSPTSVVSGRRLERQLSSTVAGTLERTPGVAVSSIGPATARPVIRGLSGDRVLVLEDGQRPGDLSSTSGDHAVAVEVVTARQVEVVRGPMSLLYGSSALGGVVNVVREDVPTSLPQHPHGTATTQLSSVDRGAAAGAYTTAAVGRIALRAEASGRTASDVRTPEGALENTESQTVGLAGGAAYVADRGYAGASYRFYDNDYGIPGGFIGGHPRGVDIRMRRHTLRGEGELRSGTGPFSAVRATAGFTDYAHTELESSGSVGTRFGQELTTGELVARHEEWGPLTQGAVGVRGQFRDITTGGSLRTPSTYDWSLAGFAVEELGSGPLRLQGGLRYEFARYVPRERSFISVGGERIPVRPRRFGSLSGSAGVLYDLGGGLRVGSSVSRSFRTPDFTELYSNGPHLAAGTFDVGDPELRKETATGVDAFTRLTRPGLRAEVAVYRNWLDGYIFPSSRGRVELGSQGGVARAQYTNEDAVFSGFEAEAEWSVMRRLVVEGSASYVQARFTSDRAPIPVVTPTDTTLVPASEHPPLIPPLMGRVGARWEAGGWFAGAGVRMAARQDRVGDFEQPTAAYAVADLDAGVRLRRGARLHTLTLRLDNLTNAEYRNHLSRVKEIMPEPGRGLSLLYRLTY